MNRRKHERQSEILQSNAPQRATHWIKRYNRQFPGPGPREVTVLSTVHCLIPNHLNLELDSYDGENVLLYGSVIESLVHNSAP